MHQFHLAEDAAVIARAWLGHLQGERRVAAKTLDAYARDLSQFGAFLEVHLGQAASVARLAVLRTADFRSFLAQRRNDGIESRSLARQLSAIRSFFKYAERHGHFKTAGLAGVRSPKLPHRLPRPLPQEAAQLAVMEQNGDAAPWVATRDRAIFMLLYGCGLRISEALALTRDAFSRDPLVVTGKGGKTRLVPAVEEVRRAVEAYLQVCPFRLAAGEPMFRGVKGGPLNPRIVQLEMQRMRGFLGLGEKATPHALRHSFASHMLGEGADLRVIQELLGHASLSTTQVYTEVNRAHLLAQYKKAFE